MWWCGLSLARMGMTDALCRATPRAHVTFAVTEESYFPGLIGPTRQ